MAKVAVSEKTRTVSYQEAQREVERMWASKRRLSEHLPVGYVQRLIFDDITSPTADEESKKLREELPTLREIWREDGVVRSGELGSTVLASLFVASIKASMMWRRFTRSLGMQGADRAYARGQAERVPMILAEALISDLAFARSHSSEEGVLRLDDRLRPIVDLGELYKFAEFENWDEVLAHSLCQYLHISGVSDVWDAFTRSVRIDVDRSGDEGFLVHTFKEAELRIKKDDEGYYLSS